MATNPTLVKLTKSSEPEFLESGRLNHIKGSDREINNIIEKYAEPGKYNN